MSLTRDEYMTVEQYCAEFDISTKTAQRQRLRGDGPPWVRIGLRRIAYRRRDVDAWAQKRTFQHRAAEAIGLACT